jgi:hypothetical protein
MGQANSSRDLSMAWLGGRGSACSRRGFERLLTSRAGLIALKPKSACRQSLNLILELEHIVVKVVIMIAAMALIIAITLALAGYDPAVVNPNDPLSVTGLAPH